MRFFATVMSIAFIFTLSACRKVNDIRLPELENYWTIEEEIYRVNPAKGTAWIEGLKSVVSTSTVETVLLIQFKDKPTGPGKFVTKAYNPGGSASLAGNECAVSVVGPNGASAYISTGKANEEVEITYTGDGRLRFSATGLEVKDGNKSSLLTFRVISK